MIITPIRVRFTVNLSSRDLEGIPTAEELEVTTKEDYDTQEGAYSFHFETFTHDQGDSGRGSFYQIAFRIDDPSPYSMDELELHLDDSVFEDPLHRVENDLYQNGDLWYQRSFYRYNPRTRRYEVIKDEEGIPEVDSITASGVFRVVAKMKNEQIAQAPGNPSPWIYILPGNISISEYKRMLSDLLSLHERLIVNHSSSVGIGTTDVDFQDIKEAIPCIKRIIKTPGEQLEKKYTKSEAVRIKHFDQRVLMDYIRTGGSGKITSIGYSENHDSYENQIIKLLAHRITLRFPESNTPKREVQRFVPEIKNRIESMGLHYIDENTESIKIENTINQLKTIILFDSGEPPLNDQRRKKIIVKCEQDYCVITTIESNSHNFMKLQGDIKSDLYNFKLKTRDFREAIFFLEKLCSFFCNRNVDNEVNTIKIICREANLNYLFPYAKKKCKVYCYDVTGISEINDDSYFDSTPIKTIKKYFNEVEKLCKEYGFIQFQDSRYETLKIQESLVTKMRKEERTDFVEEESIEAIDELRKLITHKWFNSVSLKQLSTKSIHKTPKFIQNKDYAKTYKILSGILKKHPLLSAEFNISAFGVRKTEQVYEYWVFYKILNSLLDLGFRIIDGYENIISDFRVFISTGGLNREDHANYRIKLTRQLSGNHQMDLEMGYDYKFIQRGMRPRSPDLYLMVQNENRKLWVFMDAKYKPFSVEHNTRFSIYDEIYKTSIVKYIENILPLLPGTDNKILGSYIIASSITELNKDLCSNGRLFGGKRSIIEYGIRTTNNEIISQRNGRQWIEDVDNDNGYPEHKYGAIELIPGKEEELKSLLLLVFEYLFTEGKDNHYYLENCWNCNSTDVQIIASLTQGGYNKYYSMCQNQECKMFRVQNHCSSSGCANAIIKHPFYNFHNRDTDCGANHWAYLCPVCGKGIRKQQNEAQIQDFEEAPPWTEEEMLENMPPEDDNWYN